MKNSHQSTDIPPDDIFIYYLCIISPEGLNTMKIYKIMLLAVVTLILFASVATTAMEAGTFLKRGNKLLTSTLLRLTQHRWNTRQLLPGPGGGCHGGGGCPGGGCHNNTNMTDITGIFIYEGYWFKIGTMRMNFGPRSYINSTTATYDYDGDGSLETIFNELQGLLGTTITLTGLLRSQGTMLIVFYINGTPYRPLSLCN